MRRALLVVSVVVLWSSLAAPGIQSAAAGTVDPFRVVHTDPVWVPTVLEVNEWVHDGINAAADGVALQNVPGVKRWAWGYPAGEPCGRGQTLRFVVVGAPQLVATVAGWTAAWDEATWARIQLDQDDVAAEVTRSVAARWRRGHLLVAVGIQGRPEPNGGYRPAVAIHYDNAWRCRHEGGFSTLEGFVKVGASERGRTALWATARVIRDALDCSLFSDVENTVVALLELQRVSPGPLDIPFDPRLPTPTVQRAGWARVAVGDPDSLRYVDLRLDAE
jgi:hypothetical protein